MIFDENELQVDSNIIELLKLGKKISFHFPDLHDLRCFVLSYLVKDGDAFFHLCELYCSNKIDRTSHEK